MDLLYHVFSVVCGQNPDHTWAPGGVLLPCCQRCTGLYAGACIAALLHLVLRPKLTGRFLLIHGAFLILMAPFGFHWVAHGGLMRTLTGVLFGFGVVTFLWLPLDSKLSSIKPPQLTLDPSHSASRAGGYGIGLGLSLWIVPTVAQGGSFNGCVLMVLASGGLLAFCVLILANAGVAVAGTTKRVGRALA